MSAGSTMEARGKAPVLLMVSGGSDSEALLELACAWRDGAGKCADDGERVGADPLLTELGDALSDPTHCTLHVLHVNHLLRGGDADEDEAFVMRRCAELGVACTVERVDVAALARAGGGGMEAVAREQRYRLAEHALDALCEQARVAPERGVILTAHTLDDRIETFFMRALVGTGPGGLASIPRRRGSVLRPLLDVTREQLRAWLRRRHPGMPDDALWREDLTNDDGSNFRSQVRHALLPAARALRPGFERSLARTMDLIAEEDAAQQAQAQALVYLNLSWDGEEARLPVAVLAQAGRPLARRALRAALLVVEPDARLESGQIERILEHMDAAGFSTEVSGGVRVTSDAVELRLRPLAQARA